MSPETVDQIKEALEPLADLAQQGAEFSWEVIVQQVIIQGVLNLAAALLFAVITVAGLLAARKCYQIYQSYESSFDGEGWIFGMGASLAASALMFAVALANFSAGVPKLLNPGYYALQEVAKMVGVS